MAWSRFRERIFPVHAHPAGQMRVQIDQSWQQGRVTQIDYGRAVWNREMTANLNDFFTFHSHHCRSHGGAPCPSNKRPALMIVTVGAVVCALPAVAQGNRGRLRAIGTW